MSEISSAAVQTQPARSAESMALPQSHSAAALARIRVLICGPNLSDQSKGSFQIHKPGCEHINRIGGEDPWIFGATCQRDVVEEIYGDQIGESGETWEDYAGDVFFSPCCGLMVVDTTAQPAIADPVVSQTQTESATPVPKQPKLKTIGKGRNAFGKCYVLRLGDRQAHVSRNAKGLWVMDRFPDKLYMTLNVAKNNFLEWAENGGQEVQKPILGTLDGPRGTYECVDPCAWLASGIVSKGIRPTPSMLLTLDCYGWLTADGEPDYDRAVREFKRAGQE